MFVQVDNLNLQTRYYHSATAISLGPGLTEVTVFGGKYSGLDHRASTTLLRFGEYFVGLHSYIEGNRLIESADMGQW